VRLGHKSGRRPPWGAAAKWNPSTVKVCPAGPVGAPGDGGGVAAGDLVVAQCLWEFRCPSLPARSWAIQASRVWSIPLSFSARSDAVRALLSMIGVLMGVGCGFGCGPSG
jgi:hypothetical protein